MYPLVNVENAILCWHSQCNAFSSRKCTVNISCSRVSVTSENNSCAWPVWHCTKTPQHMDFREVQNLLLWHLTLYCILLELPVVPVSIAKLASLAWNCLPHFFGLFKVCREQGGRVYIQGANKRLVGTYIFSSTLLGSGSCGGRDVLNRTITSVVG